MTIHGDGGVGKWITSVLFYNMSIYRSILNDSQPPVLHPSSPTPSSLREKVFQSGKAGIINAVVADNRLIKDRIKRHYLSIKQLPVILLRSVRVHRSG